MLLRDYTKPELEHFIKFCNFTDSEMQYFLLKSRDCSNVKISLEMNISEQQVCKISRRVRSKIERVKNG